MLISLSVKCDFLLRYVATVRNVLLYDLNSSVFLILVITCLSVNLQWSTFFLLSILGTIQIIPFWKFPSCPFLLCTVFAGFEGAV